jgi:hypothetical protein
MANARKNCLTVGEAEEVLMRVVNSPLQRACARPGPARDAIDPNYENRGYCFGRALHCQAEALVSGLGKEFIRKIALTGKMVSGDTEWGWHIATAVAVKNNSYLVLDAGFYRAFEAEYGRKLISMNEWYGYFERQYAKKGRVRRKFEEWTVFDYEQTEYGFNAREHSGLVNTRGEDGVRKRAELANYMQELGRNVRSNVAALRGR